MIDLSGVRTASSLELRPTSPTDLDLAAHQLGLSPGGLVAASPAALVDALIAVNVPPGERVALALPEDPAVIHAIVRLGRLFVDVGRGHDLRVDVAALRFLIGDQPVALVWLGDPGFPLASGLPRAHVARLAARGAPLLLDRREAADGGLRRLAGGEGTSLALLSVPCASPARAAALLAGPASVVGAVGRQLAPGPMLPPLAEALREARQGARRAAACVSALMEGLHIVPGLLVDWGPAAYVYVRLPGLPAAELALWLERFGIRVAPSPGPRTREGVRILAPREPEVRRVLVEALRELARVA